MGHIHVHIFHIYVKGTVLPFSPFIGNSPKYIIPGGVISKEPACQGRKRVLSPGGDDSLEEGACNHSAFLPGESHGQRSLAGHSPWDFKASDTTEVT